MKLFLLSFLFLFNCYAGNWVAHSTLKSGGVAGYSLEKDCLKSGEKCYDIGSSSTAVYSEVDIQVDDKSKPNYSKSQVNECGEYCEVLFKDLVCDDELERPILNRDLKQIYCSKFLSYDKKTEKDMQIDTAKLAAYNAEKTSLATKTVQRSAIKKARDCGDSAISEMIRLNAIKGLTALQKKQFLDTYKDIKGLLEVGNLAQAITDIQAMPVDGVLVTADDKISLLAFIDSCK